jgi:L-asparaginase
MAEPRRVLLLYTGGTIGSVMSPASGGLEPIDFNEIHRHVPELHQPERTLEALSFDPPMDSSNVGPAHWQRIAGLIADAYDRFDGFVVLHGTDTLAYTASALSFMLEGLSKPVILTGSQLPIGLPRTDGRENLLAAVELASACDALGQPRIQEVAVYFGSSLYRGNRVHKHSAESLQAMVSPNFPPLAEVGVEIAYAPRSLAPSTVPSLSAPLPPLASPSLRLHAGLEPQVAWLPFFPGISLAYIEQVLAWPALRGVVFSTFGSGNAPDLPGLLPALAHAHARGVVSVHVSQCGHGAVHPDRYATAHQLRDAGVIPGADMTPESALTKLMHLLGTLGSPEAVRAALPLNLRGELTPRPF